MKTYRCYCSTSKTPFKSFSRVLWTVKCCYVPKGLLLGTLSDRETLICIVLHAYNI